MLKSDLFQFKKLTDSIRSCAEAQHDLHMINRVALEIETHFKQLKRNGKQRQANFFIKSIVQQHYDLHTLKNLGPTCVQRWNELRKQAQQTNAS